MACAGAATSDTVRLCGVEWPPFTYAENGNIESGISFRIYQEAFRRLGMSFEAHALPWPRCLRLVELGHYDAVIDNADLEPFVAGSHPTASYPLAIYVLADFPVDDFSWDFMRRKRIGMVRGYDYTPTIAAFEGWRPRYFTTDEQMLRVLQAGRIDYALGDLYSVPILSERIGIEIKRLRPLVDSTNLYLVFNADRADLMRRYDAVIGQMIEDGTLDAIYLEFMPLTYSDVMRLNDGTHAGFD
ncbi:substrate-binding periplasmic protein [Saccharospirillum salsuginis]|nr:transporter substrate-binding domain-containing protein [Saccharospirillum salsuginis]